VLAAAALSLLAVVAIGLTRGVAPFYYDDGVIALHLLEGKGFSLAFYGEEGPTASRAPFQPFLLAAVHGLLGYQRAALVAILLMHTAALITTGLLVGALARRRMGACGADLVAAAVMLHPALLWLAANPAYLDRRVIVSLPLQLLAVLATVRAVDGPSARRALAAGAAIGLAALSEPPLLWLVLVPVGLLATDIGRRPASVHRAAALAGHGPRADSPHTEPRTPRPLEMRGTLAAMVTVGGLLVVGPWLARNALVFERPMPLRDAFGALAWIGNTPHSDGLLLPHLIQDQPQAPADHRGIFTFRGHGTSLPFRTRDTLPASVREGLPRLDEPARSRLLGAVAWQYVREHPARFASLTAHRIAWLAAGPPLRTSVPSWLVASLHGVLGIGFLLALVGTVRIGGALGAMLAAVLGTWIVFYGLTHCGLLEYRLALEPFVLLSVASAATTRSRA